MLGFFENLFRGPDLLILVALAVLILYLRSRQTGGPKSR
jgi:hypothetical protein